MSIIPYLLAGAGSSTIRILETFFPISKDAQRYLNREIGFKEATDGIVKHINIYVPLTTAKVICDAIVLSMTSKWIYDILFMIRSIFKDLLNCGLHAFQNGIALSLKHFFTALQSCSISLISTQLKHLCDTPKKAISSISIIDLCNISNGIHLFIIGTTAGLAQTIQLELMKYWLECMGIIRAVAESHNINFVKYMNRSCSRQINTSSSIDDHSIKFTELQWKPEKDPDFKRIVTVSLEDIFRGAERTVTVKREIRDPNKRAPENEEAKYTVIIEPGCPDGKTFRFNEAGDRDPVNIPADLVVEIQTEKHPLYERSGSNLIYTKKISLQHSLKGVTGQVPLIDGSMKECDSPGVINPNTRIIIDDAGLPDPTNGGIRGRLIVKFDIEFPDTILGTEPIERNLHN